MSSADVIDALFVRTVDMVQSLPKQGPIQTSYEEKLALYSLYKQATEGDVQSKRPGMLDMLGRAKWDAWAKVRGLPARDAKQMYVESMLRILRRFSDRPQAAALIEELEAFSGQVAQRVMDGSLAEVDSDGSTASSDDADDNQPAQPRRLHSEMTGASAPGRSHQDRPWEGRPRVPQAGPSTDSLLARPDSVAGTSTAATRGGNQASLAATPLASDSQESGSDDSDDDDDGDDFDPRIRQAAISGQGPDRSYFPQQGHPASRSNNRTRSGAPRSHISSPPPSALGLRAHRPSSVTGASNRFHSTLQSPAPSAATPYHPHPQAPHHHPHPHHQQRPAEPQQYTRSAYAPSSIGGRSGGRAGPSSQPIPRPPSTAGFPPSNRPEIDTALQSIQASLAALHERLNQVESAVPKAGGDDARRRRGSAGGSTATGRLFAALGNVVHDIRALLGLESTSQRSPRSEALAPSFLASGGGHAGGRGQAPTTLLSASFKLLVALLNLAARLALDIVSFALVSSVFLYAFRKITGAGQPAGD
ncbi:uncharacterized protein PSFLO_05973 [Pseudozyma flocculosa]|uniref:ACB domain-containing protein n=1 Tax=Pseudozyma flocculosa TaxID=84751 RepID=A0A5C3FAM3_9BASI|nr:uncharacterized protein PSFLO_05973 [Pseudozyma flocculosa]